MDKQKQIEEMAVDIAKRDCYLWEHCPKEPKHNCVSQDPEIMLESNKKYITIATWLVNAGYCKIPKGAVVLTREEYEKLDFTKKIFGSDDKVKASDIVKMLAFTDKKAREEAVEQFARKSKQRLKDKLHRGKALHTTVFGKEYVRRIFKEAIDEICKEITGVRNEL